MIQSFREFLIETEMLENFTDLVNKLRSGMGRGAMLSTKQCHLVLMAFSHQQGTEKAFQELTGPEIPPKEQKTKQNASVGLINEENRCSHRHPPTGTRCVREKGHDHRHHYRCAGIGCPGYPWVASEMQHPPSCIVGDNPNNASRDEISSCSCGSKDVKIRYPYNHPTGDIQYVNCLNCDRKGPAKQSIGEAIRAWNRIMMNEASLKEKEEKTEV